MKVLVDECLPVDLRLRLVGHDVFTVEYCGWKGIRNGRLLALAAGHGFDVLVTVDLGMEHSQARANLPIAVLLLHAKSTSIRDLDPLVAPTLAALSAPQPRAFVHVRP